MEENGRLIKFLYNEDREVVAEETGNGTITRYIRGLGIISSDSEEAKTYYHYVSDEQGSITHVLSEDAEILNHYSYDAFGNIIEKTEKVENRFCYNGEMLDPITQQYYLRARFYNPVIGRFTQEDTYYGDGLNLYQYCQANPVGYVDPSGHNVCPVLKSKYEEYRKQHPEATAAETYEAVTGKDPLKKDGSKGGTPTISSADRIKIDAWDYTPSDELYLKYKKVFDNPKYYNQKTGAINWPQNDGFASTPIDEVLQPGTRIDRYGSDFGSFTSPEGIPYEMRAVAPGTDLKPYSVFEVVEPINVKAGEIAPWFDEPGGGIQYLLPDTVDELLDAGILRRIK